MVCEYKSGCDEHVEWVTAIKTNDRRKFSFCSCDARPKVDEAGNLNGWKWPRKVIQGIWRYHDFQVLFWIHPRLLVRCPCWWIRMNDKSRSCFDPGPAGRLFGLRGNVRSTEFSRFFVPTVAVMNLGSWLLCHAGNCSKFCLQVSQLYFTVSSLILTRRMH